MAAVPATRRGMWIALAMFALIALLLAPRNDVTAISVLCCFLLLVPLAFSRLQMPKWLWVAAVSIATAVAFSFVPEAFRARVLGQASGYVAIASLLYFMAYIPFVIRDDGGIASIKHGIRMLFNRSQAKSALFGAAVMSPMVSVAAVPLVSQIVAAPQASHRTARYTAIGTTLSMIWAPSFAPIALVLQSFPSISWVRSLLITLPIFGFGLYFFWPSGIGGSLDQPADGRSGRLRPFGILFFMLSIAVVLIAIGIGSTIALTTAFAIGLIVHLLDRAGAASFDLFDQSELIWNRIGADATLFVAAGCMAATLTALLGSGVVVLTVDALSSTAFLAPIIIATVLPLANRLPIHPVLLFSVFFPLLSHQRSGIEAYVHYASWVCYWSASLLVSPVSVVNLSIGTAFSDRAYARTMEFDSTGSIVFSLIVGVVLAGILYAVS